mmetsp:Transcript_124757/g.216313  ORF Transcript_124757/g.216313 Transcript_124757/m.216313 type:complete len:691 (+) Transcript_124757:81-2153(+)
MLVASPGAWPNLHSPHVARGGGCRGSALSSANPASVSSSVPLCRVRVATTPNSGTAAPTMKMKMNNLGSNTGRAPGRMRTSRGTKMTGRVSRKVTVPAQHSHSMVALPGPMAVQLHRIPNIENTIWDFAPKGSSLSPEAAGMARGCRILCYGDSLTAGFCANGLRYEPYGDTLSESLNMGGASCEVGVCGLVGHTAETMITELSHASVRDIVGRPGKGLVRILEEDRPIDLVVLMVGTNDLGKGTHPQDIADDICALHTECHARGVPTISLAPPTGISMQRGWARSNREQLADILSVRIGARVGAADGVLAHFDAEELLPRSHGNKHWEPDEIHFSAAGSIELGKLLAAWILPAVLDAFCQKGGITPAPAPAPAPAVASNRGRSASPVRPGSPTGSPPIISAGSAAPRGRLEAHSPASIEARPSAVHRGSSMEVPRTDRPVRSKSPPDLRRGNTCTFEVGSMVEVWSKTYGVWCKGLIEKVEGQIISVEYALPDGGLSRKDLPFDHPDIQSMRPTSYASQVARSTTLIDSSTARASSPSPVAISAGTIRAPSSPPPPANNFASNSPTSAAGAMTPLSPTSRMVPTSTPIPFVPDEDKEDDGDLAMSTLDESGVQPESTAEEIEEDRPPPPLYAVSDLVEVWSNSKQAWCRGRVKKVSGGRVAAEFVLPDGSPAKKVVPETSQELRHFVVD